MKFILISMCLTMLALVSALSVEESPAIPKETKEKPYDWMLSCLKDIKKIKTGGATRSELLKYFQPVTETSSSTKRTYAYKKRLSYRVEVEFELVEGSRGIDESKGAAGKDKIKSISTPYEEKSTW